MEDRIEKRLKELRTEFELGQKMLAEIEARKVEIQQSMLRISGAIQFIEEEFVDDNEQEDFGNAELENNMVVAA